MKDSIEIKLNSMEEIKRFNAEVSEIEADVNLFRERIEIDAKSYLGLIAFDFSKPAIVRIITDDENVCGAFLNTMSKYAKDKTSLVSE